MHQEIIAPVAIWPVLHAWMHKWRGICLNVRFFSDTHTLTYVCLLGIHMHIHTHMWVRMLLQREDGWVDGWVDMWQGIFWAERRGGGVRPPLINLNMGKSPLKTREWGEEYAGPSAGRNFLWLEMNSNPKKIIGNIFSIYSDTLPKKLENYKEGLFIVSAKRRRKFWREQNPWCKFGSSKNGIAEGGRHPLLLSFFFDAQKIPWNVDRWMGRWRHEWAKKNICKNLCREGEHTALGRWLWGGRQDGIPRHRDGWRSFQCNGGEVRGQTFVVRLDHNGRTGAKKTCRNTSSSNQNIAIAHSPLLDREKSKCTESTFFRQ